MGKVKVSQKVKIYTDHPSKNIFRGVIVFGGGVTFENVCICNKNKRPDRPYRYCWI